LPGLSVVSWITQEELARAGWALVCFSRDPGCREQIRTQTPDRPEVRRLEVNVTPQFWGRSGRPEQFLVALVPPTGS
jgi:hypothetical protein